MPRVRESSLLWEVPPPPTHALVRPPGARFAQALTSQTPRLPIDVARARSQHQAYVQALGALGLQVHPLAPDDDYPDACFVQDTAVVLGVLAVVCRLGAPSRQGEEAAVAQALASHLRLARIEPPGTLEGGDVLRVGRRLFVGLSGRSNRQGIAQLEALAAPLGLAVTAAPVGAGLHLLSGCTYLGRGMLLATGAQAALPQFLDLEILCVPHEEAWGANCLVVGDQVLLPDDCPRLRQLLAQRGFRVLGVPMSEFAKADGGLTCLSVLW
ncbi:MAG: hypothetical protein GX605_04980 [Chloroflexi bacterium]|nr:hypothetical protein [Chloroflexota bacterium]